MVLVERLRLIMRRGVLQKPIVLLREMRGTSTWQRSQETTIRKGSQNLNLWKRVAYSTSTSTPEGKVDFESSRKLLIEKTKKPRVDDLKNQRTKAKAPEHDKKLLRKWAAFIIVSGCAIFMANLGFMAYSPSFRTFQRTESPRISQIADVILGVESETSDRDPSVENEIKKKRLHELQRQHETAQCSVDAQ